MTRIPALELDLADSTDRDPSLELVLQRILQRIMDGQDVAFGRYELTRLVGSGGMGHVFEAWDHQLQRRVAIKLLRAVHDDEMALREARCLARVTDPHVAAVHEVGRCCGLAFIAMELIDGQDLRHWLRERPRGWQEVLGRIIDAGRGLAAAHRAGLVHGDVKPANMIVGRDGRVRLVDFGLARAGHGWGRTEAGIVDLHVLARLVAASVEQEFVTRGLTGEAAGGSPDPEPDPELDRGPDRAAAGQPPRSLGGTWAYMAPECILGARGHSPRADQYSLCATAWEALFGVRPYAGDDAQELLASMAVGELDEGGGRPRGMPRVIVTILARGLDEDETRRWPSVEVLLDALEEAREPRSKVLHCLVSAARQVVQPRRDTPAPK